MPWTLADHAALYACPSRADLPKPLPMPVSGARRPIRPAATRWSIRPQARDFRTEKRYSGGQANQLVHFRSGDACRQADHRRPARQPRSHVDRQTRSITTPTATATSTSTPTTRPAAKPARSPSRRLWDVRWPSTDRAAAHRVRTGRRVANPRREDRQEHAAFPCACPTTASTGGPVYVSAANLIETVELSPKGERVAVRGARRHLLGARGERPHAQPHAFARRAR